MIIQKSARAKRVILKIAHDNQPTVVIPKYVPYAVGISFARKNATWILDHISRQPQDILRPHMPIGRTHRMVFISTEAPTIKSRVVNNVVTVTHPAQTLFSETAVQQEAKKAATRAIKKEAEIMLPQLLHRLAQEFGYHYRSVSVKNMRSRWGSCSNTGIINLNIWLMQLPDALVKYVCCHELAHLNNPHHQPQFWEELSVMIPDYREHKKQLKKHSPSLNTIHAAHKPDLGSQT